MKFDKRIIEGHVLAVATMLVWGTTFIASKILLGDFSTSQVMMMRNLTAYLTLLALNHKMIKTDIKEEISFFLLSLSGVTLYYLLECESLNISSTSNVSIIVSSAPIMTVILAHLFTDDEKINRYIVAGGLTAFAGVVLVVFNGAVVLRLRPIGDMLALGAALSWAVYSMLLKNSINRFNPLILTRKIMFYAMISSVPLVLMDKTSFASDRLVEPSNIICILFLGMLGSGICYVIWSVVSKRIGTVTANNYIYMSPFITMVAAALILGEEISLMGSMGALLIICGVVVSGMKKKVIQEPETE